MKMSVRLSNRGDGQRNLAVRSGVAKIISACEGLSGRDAGAENSIHRSLRLNRASRKRATHDGDQHHGRMSATHALHVVSSSVQLQLTAFTVKTTGVGLAATPPAKNTALHAP